MRILLRNRMALVGLIILIGYVFIATAAPILTPYSPQGVGQSGQNAQPEWITAFPDGYYLSKNLVVVDDPEFSSPAAVRAWTITASPAVMASLQVSYARGVATTGSKGSLQLIYSGTEPANVTVSRTFNYPYHGPPARFLAGIALRPSGVTSSQPMGISVFIDRVGDQVFNLWQTVQQRDYTQYSSTGGWVHPPYSLDSAVGGVQDAIGATNAALDPAQIIFSSRQDYSYGVQLTFNGQQQVNIDDFSFQLLGTAWGLLGTDFNGTDILAQVLYGARISLFVGLLATLIGIGLGLLAGLVAGFLGGLADEGLMRFTDMMLVIPSLPLLLVLVAVLGANIFNIIVIIGFLGWMGFARIIRSQVLSLKERPFIEAARAAGAGNSRIMATHIFPNIVSLTYVNLALAVPAAILTEAALEFLGLGDPTVVSWGIMFYHAEIAGSLFKWWWIMPPGLSIALVSLSFILIGYSLDELFNPKLRKRR